MSMAVNLGGHGAGVTAYTPQPQMHHQQPQPMNVPSGPLLPPGFLGPPTGNETDSRGDNENDFVVTVDISSAFDINCSIWYETESKCESVLTLKPGAFSIKNDGTVSLGKDCTEDKLIPLDLLSSTSGDDGSKLEKLQKFFSFVHSSIHGDAAKAFAVGNKKKKKMKQSITLVLPSSATQELLISSIRAVQRTGLTLRNIFSSAVSAVAGMLGDSNFESALAGSADDPLVLVLQLSAVTVDFALVRCEGGQAAKSSGNSLGYERITIVATHTETLAEVDAARAVDVLYKQIPKSSGGNGSVGAARGVSAVLYTGSELTAGLAGALKKIYGKGVYILKCREDSCSRGACLLSAAELSSSKQYAQRPDGSWRLLFQLPVADGYLAEDVGLKEEQAPGSAAVIEQIFSAGSLVPKMDVGPPRPLKGADAALSAVRKYSWGPTYWRGAQAYPTVATPADSYPRLTVYSRKNSDAEWRSLKTIHPLAVLDKTGTTVADQVQDSTVTVAADPSTGAVLIRIGQGKRISQIKEGHWFWVQLALGLLALVGAVGLYWLYGYWQELSQVAQQEAWLREFYQRAAPEKLAADPNLVSRTIKKYSGRIFLLWRNLEKTYRGHKIPAPPFILDNPADL